MLILHKNLEFLMARDTIFNIIVNFRGFNDTILKCCDKKGGHLKSDLLHPDCAPIDLPSFDRYVGLYLPFLWFGKKLYLVWKQYLSSV